MIQVGDTVTRMLAGAIEMKLRVTAITDDRIKCGAWEFDRTTGLEIDEDLGWDKNASGSYIVLPK